MRAPYEVYSSAVAAATRGRICLVEEGVQIKIVIYWIGLEILCRSVRGLGVYDVDYCNSFFSENETMVGV